ncbi:MAG: phosphatidylglycerol lysyltransferase domain-containing protein [Candidatus Paceibacterota bacterium]
MIPEFPKMKSIELSDREEVEKITKKYPPYSDFNFISMWSWDIKGEMRLSQFHGNLIVRFTDYLTGEPFYSFLGNTEVNNITQKLLDLSIKEETKPKLYLISDDVARIITHDKFRIEEDSDNFDYIFDLEEISFLKGSKFASQRNKVNKFSKKFLDIKVTKLNLKDLDIQKKILDLDEFWLKNKIKKDTNFHFKNELLSTHKFFAGNFEDSVGIGIYNKEKLIAYSISNISNDKNFAVSHFSKADINFEGIYDYLMKENAKFLIECGCKFLNFEQDLGLPGLRNSKRSFMCRFLKKFTISFAE